MPTVEHFVHERRKKFHPLTEFVWNLSFLDRGINQKMFTQIDPSLKESAALKLGLKARWYLSRNKQKGPLNNPTLANRWIRNDLKF